MPDAAVNRSAQTTSPTVKKKPLATGDPAAQPNANARPAIQASRLGPRFAIRAVWEPPVDPTIAPTQANAASSPRRTRMVPSRSSLTVRNWDGTSDHVRTVRKSPVPAGDDASVNPRPGEGHRLDPLQPG